MFDFVQLATVILAAIWVGGLGLFVYIFWIMGGGKSSVFLDTIVISVFNISMKILLRLKNAFKL